MTGIVRRSLVLAAAAMGAGRAAGAEQKRDKVVIKPINPAGVRIPGISLAMETTPGKVLFLSGHVPFNSQGNLVAKALPEQLRQTFQNMRSTLTAAGADFRHVARLTIYVCDYDPGELAIIRSIRDEFISTEMPPASALIGVAALFDPDVRVEIDAIAVLP